MDTNDILPFPTKAGTVGGTLLVVILQISGGELLKTAVMAATGAVISFFTSFILQRTLRKRKK